MRGFLTGLGNVLKSYGTAPDGESYAPGRLMAAVLFSVAQWIVIFATCRVGEGHATMSDWQGLMIAVAAFEAAISTTCVALILGIAPTDSGGKWWSRDASPPPPPNLEPNQKEPGAADSTTQGRS